MKNEWGENKGTINNKQEWKYMYCLEIICKRKSSK